ncbi:2-hydroxyacid dehydrogenase [Penicillium taxi]|uniref:2-hydroxyacid dehydrogenase n=1 Tax=Penicillium taxi TaxID=168475 RepID=UPI0025450137|nr:2-hydroxyacid dehydrogenase [Penicillium taxi]KAJ5907724.1 2-hydroxyacid dehydrogenase [Penicillium taxi]
MPAKRIPRVVSLGEPWYIDADYLSNFKKDFNYSVLNAKDRSDLQEKLPAEIAENGTIDALIWGAVSFGQVDEDLLKALVPGCKIIVTGSAGYNNFDVQWMADQGIWFCNTVDAVAEPTADMALFLILAVLRNTSNAERIARSGAWKGDKVVPTRDPAGLTLGIVGLGSVGKYLAKRAAILNMKIRYHNRTQLPAEEEAKYNATYDKTLQDLLGSSDVISLNCPLNDSTRNMLSDAEFAAMKDGAYLINTARGPVVDEKSLIAALESGKITRAGLDVFVNEPNPDPYFLQSDKVVVQPHNGGLTQKSFQKATLECFENIRALFIKGRPNSPVIDIKPKV